MIFQTALVGGLLLAGHASATHSHALFRRSEDVEAQLRRDADSLVASLTKRQDANAAAAAPQISTTPQSGDASKANLNAWETQTQAACMSAVMTLNGQASNPSGLSVCYNLPFLDNSTGVFQAELRMYNVSAPIDPWVGVTAADVSMTLSYLGATVQAMGATAKKRGIEGVIIERQTSMPSELKVLNYVGKINSNLMGAAMTQATLQPLLVPQIQLAATNPTSKQQVSTTLSSTEASFVNGVFAKQATTTINPSAAASASALAATVAPFIGAGGDPGTKRLVPGTSLGFFPTGLVVTGVWAGGFFLAVGLGTLGRIQFREQYRRRMKREMVAGQRTI